MTNPIIRNIPPYETKREVVNLSEIVGSRRFDVKGLESSYQQSAISDQLLAVSENRLLGD